MIQIQRWKSTSSVELVDNARILSSLAHVTKSLRVTQRATRPRLPFIKEGGQVMRAQMQALQADKEDAERQAEEVRPSKSKGKWVEQDVVHQYPGDVTVWTMCLVTVHVTYAEFIVFVTHRRGLSYFACYLHTSRSTLPCTEDPLRGCNPYVVAGRLAALDPSLTILILKFTRNLAPTSTTMTLNFGNPSPRHNGCAPIVPCAHCVGGGSSVDAMWYTRGPATYFGPLPIGHRICVLNPLLATQVRLRILYMLTTSRLLSAIL
ncbi:hypothetical protein EV424DRAFT_1554368 [Suillus variegatus]|nr:hypothetical protein EV424DRAFT_1554368 [Suillus variegatus]